MTSTNWHAYFFSLCMVTAGRSKDPSTKVGSVIVRPDKTVAGMGFNGFPRGCRDEPSLYADRDTKYSRVIHAEANAILQSAERLHGHSLYVWPYPPCDRCMATIIQAGIKHVHAPPLPADAQAHWFDSVKRGFDMAQEAGVTYTTHLNFEATK